MSTQKKNKTYKKIVEKTKFWPIVQLFENRNKFMEDVSKKTEGKIQKKIKEKDLYEEILNTVYKEKLRISNISWNADPKDDKEFWNSIKEKIYFIGRSFSTVNKGKFLSPTTTKFGFRILDFLL